MLGESVGPDLVFDWLMTACFLSGSSWIQHLMQPLLPFCATRRRPHTQSQRAEPRSCPAPTGGSACAVTWSFARYHRAPATTSSPHSAAIYNRAAVASHAPSAGALGLGPVPVPPVLAVLLVAGRAVVVTGPAACCCCGWPCAGIWNGLVL